MGERADQRQREVSALRAGLDLGLPLIDTAMYADGGAEKVVGEALAGHDAMRHFCGVKSGARGTLVARR